MVLKGERIVQKPSFQVDLHKVLNLSTGSSIATLEGRNLKTTTYTNRISGKTETEDQKLVFLFCLCFWSVSNSKVDDDLICAIGKLLSMRALTNPRCRPQFGCSIDRNSTTAYVHKLYQTEGIANIRGRRKNDIEQLP